MSHLLVYWIVIVTFLWPRLLRCRTTSTLFGAFVVRGCFQETANTSFSPDGRVLVCGSNVRPKSDETGVLKFFDVYTAEAEPELGEGNVSVLAFRRVTRRSGST